MQRGGNMIVILFSTLDSQGFIWIITDSALEGRSSIGRHYVLILEFTTILPRSRCWLPWLPNSCTIRAWQYIAVLGQCLKVCRTIRRVLVLLARLNVIWWVYWPFRHKCFFTIVTFVSKSSYSSRIRLISDLWIGWKIDVVLFLDSCLHVQQRGVLRSLFWLLTHSFHD